MKKSMIYSFCCAMLFAVFVTSCSQDKDLLDNFSKEQESLIGGDEVTFEEAKDIIESLGFDVSDLTDGGAYYLVEGDISFEKKYLKEYQQPFNDSELPQLRQARMEYLVSYPNQRHITVGIDASVPTSGKNNWRNEIRQAIDTWNGISNIVMHYVTTSNPDILISGYSDYNEGLLARGAYTLANGKPGPTVHINFNYCGGKVLSSSQKLNTMVHELGHNLGLRHTNWRGLGNESTPIDIPGTPTAGNNPDPNSVMNGGDPEKTWSGFSAADKKAMQELYPIFDFSFYGFPTTYPLTYELIRPLGMSVIGQFRSKATYKWQVGGGNILGSNLLPDVTVQPTGAYTFNFKLYITNEYGETINFYQVVGGPLTKTVNRKY